MKFIDILIFNFIAVIKWVYSLEHLSSSTLFNELKNNGYSVDDIHSLYGAIRSSLLSLSETISGNCGEGFHGLLDRQLISGDPDSLERVAGLINNNRFELMKGNLPIISLKNSEIQLPIETINDRCFGLRKNDGLGMNLCALNRVNRNEWVNAISELVLCYETGISEGKLPVVRKDQNTKAATNLGSMKPSGIDIIVEDSDEGKPYVAINGRPISQVIQSQVVSAENAIASTDAFQEENPFDYPAEPIGSSSYDFSNGAGLTDAQKLAIQESEAEHLILPAENAPSSGYAARHLGRWRKN